MPNQYEPSQNHVTPSVVVTATSRWNWVNEPVPDEKTHEPGRLARTQRPVAVPCAALMTAVSDPSAFIE